MMASSMVWVVFERLRAVRAVAWKRKASGAVAH
jgi:hypothetical protein